MGTPGPAGISALAFLCIGGLTAGAGEPLAARPEEKKSHFGAALALCPPRSPDAPKELVVRRGDRIIAIGDSITRIGGTGGGWLRSLYFALAQLHPELAWTKDVHRVEKFEKGELKPEKPAGAAEAPAAPAPPASGEKLTHVICAGIGGQTSAPIAARFAKDVVENRPAGLAKDRGWLTGEGVHLTGLGDLVIAAELLRALGLSDDEIRAYDQAKPIPGYNAPPPRGKPDGR